MLSARLGTRFSARFSRAFSSSFVANANRAIVYEKPGDPTSVLSALTYPRLPDPPSGCVNVRFILSPINPADVNVVEGVYPVKPSLDHSLVADSPVFVGGNEGLAEITEVGCDVTGLRKGDRVVMGEQQLGTWTSARTLRAEEAVKVPHEISEVAGATITVNPPTAYNMIHDFADLKEGDWLMQNGANSAVGQAVIQIAARKGLETLNFVRSRGDLESLKHQLTTLGATKVLTYDDLDDKSLRDQVKGWTNGKASSNSPDAELHAHLVSYGAMSKQPLSLPTSAFIFKNLKCHGFWQSRWNKEHSRQERETLYGNMTKMKLQESEHEILTIPASDNDNTATQRIRDIFQKLSQGQYGKKVLLKIEQPAD
ncbi:hypothetical protein EIP86_008001 [Pleurotus ostreatoroseus]|nr:hypothetical protein EIP86_008001 [Pleurotus ostreatoroseus]